MILLLCVSLLAVVPHGTEGDAQAFTALTDAQGKPLADSRYSQWVTGDVLHIESRSDFPGGRSILERATMRLRPQIEQLTWDWTEKNGEQLVRQYEVDFRTRHAVATRVDQGKRWKEDVDVEPGKTFAGIGFITAVKALRGELAVGQSVELVAVAFTPKPRTAKVKVTRDGPEPVHMAGRTIPGDRFTIHVDIPAIARLFVDPPDQHIWLIAGDPSAFLRFEGSLVEPKDPIVRIDLIPGASAHAQARTPQPRRGAGRR
jgi:hypothetical protein